MAGIDFAAHNKLTSLVRERRDALTVRWLIATAIIGGYAIVLAALAEGHPAPLHWSVIVTCWGLAVAFTIVSFIVPQKLLTDKHLLDQLQRPIALELWARRMKLKAPQAHELAGLPPSEQSLLGLTMLFERPFTFELVLSGGVGLCALAYGLVTKTVLEAAPLLLAALALNCAHYPRGLPRLVERGRKLTRVDDNDVALQALQALKDQQETQAQSDQAVARPSSAPQAPGANPRKSAVTEPNTAPLRSRRQTLGDRPHNGAPGQRPMRAESGPLSPQRPARPDSAPLGPQRTPKLTPAAGMKRVDPERDGAPLGPQRQPKLTPAAGMKRVDPGRDAAGPLLPARAPKLTPAAGMKRVEPERDPSQAAAQPRRPPAPDKR